MSEFDSLAGSADSPADNNFDNDFEKLDPYASTPEDLVSSTIKDVAEEDLFSSTAPEDVKPLVDFGAPAPEPAAFAEPTPAVDTTSESKPVVIPPKVEIGDSSSPTSCCWMKNIDPRVIDLVYWRDLKKSGIVFGSLLAVLLSLALFSVLSVVAYLALAALTVTITFVVYKKVLGAVQKTSDGHPFKAYLEFDVALPEERLHQVADAIMKNCTSTIKELRRLFLVEDLVDSLKFGLLLWVLTYIGAWFNGMTLIILGVVGLFTIPKFYETYQAQIDQYMDLIRTQVTKVVSQVREKIPIGKKKEE
jgi:hypothetical protein